MKPIKQLIKPLVPSIVLRGVQSYREHQHRVLLANLSTKEIFTTIYEKGMWGKSDNPSQPYFSGSGSHTPDIVNAYVDAVRVFLSSFGVKPSVVDLGCGDFAVGSRLRDLCGSYTACDIVDQVIAYNQKKYQDLNVVFKVVDLTRDELPKADVAFIRQVLQHLSNDEIIRGIKKLARSYKFLVISEHLPSTDDYIPNIDKPTGADIRLNVNSGIDLTLPPFNLVVSDAALICTVPEYGGVIRTIVYTLA